MKKFYSITLSFLLIISTTGVVLSKHYCHNKLISVSFFSKAKKCCGSTCNSCKNVNSSYKVSQKFVDSKTVTSKVPVTAIPIVVYFIKSTLFLHSFLSFELTGFKSPPIKDCLQIINSNFRL